MANDLILYYYLFSTNYRNQIGPTADQTKKIFEKKCSHRSLEVLAFSLMDMKGGSDSDGLRLDGGTERAWF